MVGLAILLAGCGSSSASGVSSRRRVEQKPRKNPTTLFVEGDPRSGLEYNFGHLASSADAQVITAVVNRYYAHAAADDGAAACSMLLRSMAMSVAEDYGHQPSKPQVSGKTCSEVMSKVFTHIPSQPIATLAAVKVTRVRTRGNSAYALLRSPAMPYGEISLTRVAGSWKVSSLIGREARPAIP